MNDFELEGSIQVDLDEDTKDLILKEMGWKWCFYCGAEIPPKTYYAEVMFGRDRATEIICCDCFDKLNKKNKRYENK